MLLVSFVFVPIITRMIIMAFYALESDECCSCYDDKRSLSLLQPTTRSLFQASFPDPHSTDELCVVPPPAKPAGVGDFGLQPFILPACPCTSGLPSVIRSSTTAPPLDGSGSLACWRFLDSDHANFQSRIIRSAEP